jgi:excisionase family DNA binding protein
MTMSDNLLAPRDPDHFESPLLLSLPDAAHLLGISASFARIMARKGDLPTIRLGRRVLVSRHALEQLIRSGTCVDDTESGSN